MHHAASTFLQDKGVIKGDAGGLISGKQVFFEHTLELKVSRIQSLDLDYFIDDLPAILDHSSFPNTTQGLLFSPCAHEMNSGNHDNFTCWQDINDFLFHRAL